MPWVEADTPRGLFPATRSAACLNQFNRIKRNGAAAEIRGNHIIAGVKELSIFSRLFPGTPPGEDRRMGRRWTEQDVSELRHLAQRYSAPRIAELTNRTAGGVAFKAYQLKLSLRSSQHESEPVAEARPKRPEPP
jgi:hypothetical protein